MRKLALRAPRLPSRVNGQAPGCVYRMAADRLQPVVSRLEWA